MLPGTQEAGTQLEGEKYLWPSRWLQPELRPFPPHLNSKHTKGAVKRYLQGATPRAPLVEVEGQLPHPSGKSKEETAVFSWR